MVCTMSGLRVSRLWAAPGMSPWKSLIGGDDATRSWGARASRKLGTPQASVWPGQACKKTAYVVRSLIACRLGGVWQGESVLDQLGKIFSKFGTPQESQWPGVSCLPDYVEFYPSPPQPLKSMFPMASEDTLDLLSKMFTLDPNKRITAKQALEHR